MENFAQDIPKLRIDPQRAYGGTISDYFESIEYIPLETTNESLFGNIYKLLITDSNIVIFDLDTKYILFFDFKGKFLKKTGKGGGFIPNDLYYNAFTQKIVISKYNPSGQKIKASIHHLNGDFISDALLDRETLQPMLEFIPLDKHFFAQMNFFILPETILKSNERPYYRITIHKDSAFYKSLIPVTTKNDSAYCIWGISLGGSDRNFHLNKDTLYYTTKMENILYKITKDTAIGLFQFVFPASNQLPEKYLHFQNLKSIDSIDKLKLINDHNLIHCVDNVIIKNGKLFFMTKSNGRIAYNADGTTISRNFIYDFSTKRLNAIERISPDSLNYFLPFLDPPMAAKNGLLLKDGYFYSFVSSLHMFAAKEATKSKKSKYTPVLNEYFETQDRESNPVIVKMKLK